MCVFCYKGEEKTTNFRQQIYLKVKCLDAPSRQFQFKTSKMHIVSTSQKKTGNNYAIKQTRESFHKMYQKRCPWYITHPYTCSGRCMPAICQLTGNFAQLVQVCMFDNYATMPNCTFNDWVLKILMQNNIKKANMCLQKNDLLCYMIMS